MRYRSSQSKCNSNNFLLTESYKLSSDLHLFSKYLASRKAMHTDDSTTSQSSIDRTPTLQDYRVKEPAKVNGTAIVEDLDKFFENIILVSSFGAELEFAMLLSKDKPVAENSKFSTKTVNDLIAIS